MPGVNVTYESTPQSVRETLTLADATVPTVYRYKLSLSQLEPIVIVYGNGEAHIARNERYGIIGTHYNPQSSRQEFVVCAGGYGSPEPAHQEEECGVTEGYERESTYPHGEVIHNLEVMNACATGLPKKILGQGTSGAPVYKNHLAYGIHVASSDDCRDLYEGINTVENVLHVKFSRGHPGSLNQSPQSHYRTARWSNASVSALFPCIAALTIASCGSSSSPVVRPKHPVIVACTNGNLDARRLLGLSQKAGQKVAEGSGCDFMVVEKDNRPLTIPDERVLMRIDVAVASGRIIRIVGTG